MLLLINCIKSILIELLHNTANISLGILNVYLKKIWMPTNK